MATTTCSKHFDAPPGVVFDLFNDLDHLADRVSGIVRLEKLTEGPVGLGTRFRETRVMFGKEATEEMEYTAFEPGRSFTVACESCGARYRVHHELQAAGGGTDVEIRFEMEAVSFFAKLMSPLGKIMAKSCMKAFDKDLEELKSVAEGRSAAVSPA